MSAARPIRTTYYAMRRDGEVAADIVRVNSAANAPNAVLRMVHHMQQRTYPEAVAAEVFDSTTGRLWAVARIRPSGMEISWAENIFELFS